MATNMKPVQMPRPIQTGVGKQPLKYATDYQAPLGIGRMDTEGEFYQGWKDFFFPTPQMPTPQQAPQGNDPVSAAERLRQIILGRKIDAVMPTPNMNVTGSGVRTGYDPAQSMVPDLSHEIVPDSMYLQEGGMPTGDDRLDISRDVRTAVPHYTESPYGALASPVSSPKYSELSKAEKLTHQVVRGILSPITGKTPYKEPSEAEGFMENVSYTVGSILPYLWAGQVVGAAGVGKAVAGKMVGKTVGGNIVARFAQPTLQKAAEIAAKQVGHALPMMVRGTTVSAVNQMTRLLSAESEHTVTNAIGEMVRDAGRMGVVGLVFGNVGGTVHPQAVKFLKGITPKALNEAMFESIHLGKMSSKLFYITNGALASTVSSGASGLTLGVMNAGFNYLKNPKDFESDKAIDEILTNTLQFAAMSFILGLPTLLDNVQSGQMGVQRMGFAPKGVEPKAMTMAQAYKELGISVGDKDAAKKAFRKIAKAYHPDTLKDMGLTEEQMVKKIAEHKRIVSAYAIVENISKEGVGGGVGTGQESGTTVAQAPTVSTQALQPEGMPSGVSMPEAVAPSPLPSTATPAPSTYVGTPTTTEGEVVKLLESKPLSKSALVRLMKTKFNLTPKQAGVILDKLEADGSVKKTKVGNTQRYSVEAKKDVALDELPSTASPIEIVSATPIRQDLINQVERTGLNTEEQIRILLDNWLEHSGESGLSYLPDMKNKLYQQIWDSITPAEKQQLLSSGNPANLHLLMKDKMIDLILDVSKDHPLIQSVLSRTGEPAPAPKKAPAPAPEKIPQSTYVDIQELTTLILDALGKHGVKPNIYEDAIATDRHSEGKHFSNDDASYLLHKFTQAEKWNQETLIMEIMRDFEVDEQGAKNFLFNTSGVGLQVTQGVFDKGADAPSTILIAPGIVMKELKELHKPATREEQAQASAVSASNQLTSNPQKEFVDDTGRTLSTTSVFIPMLNEVKDFNVRHLAEREVARAVIDVAVKLDNISGEGLHFQQQAQAILKDALSIQAAEVQREAIVDSLFKRTIELAYNSKSDPEVMKDIQSFVKSLEEANKTGSIIEVYTWEQRTGQINELENRKVLRKPIANYLRSDNNVAKVYSGFFKKRPIILGTNVEIKPPKSAEMQSMLRNLTNITGVQMLLEQGKLKGSRIVLFNNDLRSTKDFEFMSHTMSLRVLNHEVAHDHDKQTKMEGIKIIHELMLTGKAEKGLSEEVGRLVGSKEAPTFDKQGKPTNHTAKVLEEVYTELYAIAMQNTTFLGELVKAYPEFGKKFTDDIMKHFTAMRKAKLMNDKSEMTAVHFTNQELVQKLNEHFIRATGKYAGAKPAPVAVAPTQGKVTTTQTRAQKQTVIEPPPAKAETATDTMDDAVKIIGDAIAKPATATATTPVATATTQVGNPVLESTFKLLSSMPNKYDYMTWQNVVRGVAKETGMKEGEVSKALNKLRDDGYISIYKGKIKLKKQAYDVLTEGKAVPAKPATAPVKAKTEEVKKPTVEVAKTEEVKKPTVEVAKTEPIGEKLKHPFVAEGEGVKVTYALSNVDDKLKPIFVGQRWVTYFDTPADATPEQIEADKARARKLKNKGMDFVKYEIVGITKSGVKAKILYLPTVVNRIFGNKFTHGQIVTLPYSKFLKTDDVTIATGELNKKFVDDWSVKPSTTTPVAKAPDPAPAVEVAKPVEPVKKEKVVQADEGEYTEDIPDDVIALLNQTPDLFAIQAPALAKPASRGVTFRTGDLFKDDAEALVNAVNTVGVMGKGIALQFKKKYPKNFAAYSKAHKAGDLSIGKMFVHKEGNKVIINFPTKQHWKDDSKLEDIKSGLTDLAKVLSDNNIQSVAIPALGSGLGGLPWGKVKPLIVSHLKDLGIDVRIYEPQGVPAPAVEVAKTKPAEVSKPATPKPAQAREYTGSGMPILTTSEVAMLKGMKGGMPPNIINELVNGLYNVIVSNKRVNVPMVLSNWFKANGVTGVIDDEGLSTAQFGKTVEAIVSKLEALHAKTGKPAHIGRLNYEDGIASVKMPSRRATTTEVEKDATENFRGIMSDEELNTLMIDRPEKGSGVTAVASVDFESASEKVRNIEFKVQHAVDLLYHDLKERGESVKSIEEQTTSFKKLSLEKQMELLKKTRQSIRERIVKFVETSKAKDDNAKARIMMRPKGRNIIWATIIADAFGEDLESTKPMDIGREIITMAREWKASGSKEVVFSDDSLVEAEEFKQAQFEIHRKKEIASVEGYKERLDGYISVSQGTLARMKKLPDGSKDNRALAELDKELTKLVERRDSIIRLMEAKASRGESTMSEKVELDKQMGKITSLGGSVEVRAPLAQAESARALLDAEKDNRVPDLKNIWPKFAPKVITNYLSQFRDSAAMERVKDKVGMTDQWLQDALASYGQDRRAEETASRSRGKDLETRWSDRAKRLLIVSRNTEEYKLGQKPSGVSRVEVGKYYRAEPSVIQVKEKHQDPYSMTINNPVETTAMLEKDIHYGWFALEQKGDTFVRVKGFPAGETIVNTNANGVSRLGEHSAKDMEQARVHAFKYVIGRAELNAYDHEIEMYARVRGQGKHDAKAPKLPNNWFHRTYPMSIGGKMYGTGKEKWYTDDFSFIYKGVRVGGEVKGFTHGGMILDVEGYKARLDSDIDMSKKTLERIKKLPVDSRDNKELVKLGKELTELVERRDAIIELMGAKASSTVIVPYANISSQMDSVKEIHSYQSLSGNLPDPAKDPKWKKEASEVKGLLSKMKGMYSRGELTQDMRTAYEQLVSHYGDIDTKAYSIKPETIQQTIVDMEAWNKQHGDHVTTAGILPRRLLVRALRLQKKQLVEFSVGELQDIKLALTSMLHYQSTLGQFLATNLTAPIAEIAQTLADANKAHLRKPIRRLSNLRQIVGRYGGMGTINPGVIAEMIGDLEHKVSEDPRHQQLNDAMAGNMTQAIQDLAQVQGYFIDDLRDVEDNQLGGGHTLRKAWDNDRTQVDFEGGTDMLSTWDKIGLYLASNDLDKHATALMNGGYYLDNDARYGEENKIVLTPNDIYELQQGNMLDDKAKIWIGALRQALERAAPEINETGEKMYGISIAHNPSYWPKIVDRSSEDGGLPNMNLQRLIENLPYLQPRTDDTKPLVIVNPRDLAMKYFSAIATYVSHAIPLRDFQALIEDASIKDTMARRFGVGNRGIAPVLIDYMDRVSKIHGVTPPSNIAETMMTSAVNKLQSAVVVANPWMGVRTLASMGNFYRYGSFQQIMRAFSRSLRGGAPEELVRKWARSNYNRREYTGVPEIHEALEGLQGLWKSAFKIAVTPIARGDRYVTDTAWFLAEDIVAQEMPQLVVGSDDYYREVGHRAERWVLQGQVGSKPFETSRAGLRGTALEKLATMFMGQNNKDVNTMVSGYLHIQKAQQVYERADAETAKGDTAEGDRLRGKADNLKSEGAKSIAGVLASWLLYATIGVTIQRMWQGRRDDSLAKHFGKNLARAGVGKVYIAGQLYDAINAPYGSRRGIGTGVQDELSNVFESFGGLLAGRGTTAGQLKRGIESVSSLSGLPVANIARELQYAMNHINPILGHESDKLFRKHTNSVYYDKIWREVQRHGGAKSALSKSRLLKRLLEEMAENGVTQAMLKRNAETRGMTDYKALLRVLPKK